MEAANTVKEAMKSVVVRHLSVYYSTTSTWNFKAFVFVVTRAIIVRVHRIIYSGLVGASLSEPHTSVTALCMCVCVSMLACLFGPTTYRKF